MAIAKLLGFDLCPRLRDLAERKLYLPRGFIVPDGLEAVTVRRVSLAAIERGWDELLRLAASIRSGRVSATLALQRFGSAAQGIHCTGLRNIWADCCEPCSCATTSPSMTSAARSHTC